MSLPVHGVLVLAAWQATMLPQDLLDMLYRILRALLAAGVATSTDSQPAQVGWG